MTASLDARALLERAGVRPTAQRLGLAELLFSGASRHVTAEQVWEEARAAGAPVSLATVYNTLNHFVDVGLLRRVDVGAASGAFDTNPTPHHHLLDERTGALHDLPLDAVELRVDPARLPPGVAVAGIDVVVRVRR